MINYLHISKIASAFIARWKSLLGITGILLLSLLVVSCAEEDDTDADTFAVGGAVSGLDRSEEIVLTLTHTDGTEEKKITGVVDAATDDKFAFDTKLAEGDTYTVAVKTPPAGKTCTVDPATEQTMGDGDVSTIKVSCVTETTGAETYTVGGSITGQTGDVVLKLVSGTVDEDVTVKVGDTTFTFPTELEKDATYTVTVATDPTGQTCTVTAGTGTVTEEVTTVVVACETAAPETYTVGGSITGQTGDVVLKLVSGTVDEDVTVKVGDTTFTFPTELEKDATYTVTVATDPTGQTCTVTAGTGTVTEEVTTVVVACVVKTHSVNVKVSGLALNERIDLTLTPTSGTAEDGWITSLSDAATDDIFIFTKKLAENATYTVSVKTAPAGKTCTVDPANTGTQTMGDGDATITVTCVVTPTYVVGVTVVGLGVSEDITLTLTPTGGTAESKTFTGDSDDGAHDEFAFDTKLAQGTTYTVSVTTAPGTKTCTYLQGEVQQTMGDSTPDADHVLIRCSDTTR